MLGNCVLVAAQLASAPEGNSCSRLRVGSSGGLL
jgi:hypothetical protein